MPGRVSPGAVHAYSRFRVKRPGGARPAEQHAVEHVPRLSLSPCAGTGPDSFLQLIPGLLVDQRLVGEHDRLAVLATPGRDYLTLLVARCALDTNLAFQHDDVAEQQRRRENLADGGGIPLAAARGRDAALVQLAGYRAESPVPDALLNHPFHDGRFVGVLDSPPALLAVRWLRGPALTVAYAARRIAIPRSAAAPAAFIAQPLPRIAAPLSHPLAFTLCGENTVLKLLAPAFGAGVGAVADINDHLPQRRHVPRELEVVEHVAAEPVHLIGKEAVNLPDLVRGQPRPETGALPDRVGPRHVHVHVHEDHMIVVVLGILCDPGPLACRVDGRVLVVREPQRR